MSDITIPADRMLSDIEGGGNAQFRLKVIDESDEHGRVLAEVYGITPLGGDNSTANRNSILPVVVRDLGSQVWRVNFDDPGGRPVLELNKAVEGISQIAVNDAQFLALVYPAAVRLNLLQILRLEHFSDTDGPADDWRVQWLTFATSLPTISPPPTEDDSESGEDVQNRQLEWIDDAVEAFCLYHKLGEQFGKARAVGGNS